MKRFAVITIAVCLLTGCWHPRALTQPEKDALTAGQTIGGVPMPLAIAITNLISLGLGALGGHKNGRRKERKVQACKTKDTTNA